MKNTRLTIGALTTAALGLVATAALAGQLNVYTQTVIAAPAEAVWATLIDVERYAEWNPYHVSLSGNVSVGSRLSLDIVKPDGKEITLRPSVTQLEPNRVFAWGGGLTGLFKGEHIFELTVLGPCETQLVQKEWFTGLFVPFVPLNGIDEGYRSVNEALKRHLEARTGDQGNCA